MPHNYRTNDYSYTRRAISTDDADRSAHGLTQRGETVIPSSFQILRTQSIVPLYLSLIRWVVVLELLLLLLYEEEDESEGVLVFCL